MTDKIQFAIADVCSKCKKPIVVMTDEEMRKKFGGAPITAIVSLHYVTPWGVVCKDCMPNVTEKWNQRETFNE